MSKKKSQEKFCQALRTQTCLLSKFPFFSFYYLMFMSCDWVPTPAWCYQVLATIFLLISTVLWPMCKYPWISESLKWLEIWSDINLSAISNGPFSNKAIETFRSSYIHLCMCVCERVVCMCGRINCVHVRRLVNIWCPILSLSILFLWNQVFSLSLEWGWLTRKL